MKAAIKKRIYHFDYDKYWKMRDFVIDSRAKKLFEKFKMAVFHYRIRKMEAFNQASIGLMSTGGGGTQFAGHPTLPHGLYGILINDKAVIGKNCTILHRVTIGESKGLAPTIGDNCFIGANATIIGGITIGDNVKIGAGCIVACDIPDNATVVMDRPRIILQNNE